MEECGDDLPQFLVMENVPQVHSEKNIGDFAEWINFLESLGYKSKWADLNAANYGVPQNRNRCFMVSWLKNNRPFMFPEPIHPVAPLSDYLEKDVDDSYILSDGYLTYFYKKAELEKSRGNGFSFDPITDPSRGICRTITTKCGGRMTDPFVKREDGKIRKLTEFECFRLMGVDAETARKMIAANSGCQCRKQAGNSIVVDVLMAVFRNLFDENAPGQMTVFDYL